MTPATFKPLVTLLLFAAPVLAQAPDASAVIRVGLGPPALAAAGVAGGEVADIISDFAASDQAQTGALAAADAACRSARSAAGKLQRLIRSGKASAEEVSAYQIAKADLTQAEADRQAVLDALFAAAIQDLAAGKQAILTQIRANQARNLPIEFLVESRTDQQWLDLKKALQHEKVCLQLELDLDPEIEAALATWRGKTAVSTAKANLDGNGASVTAAWDSAVD